MEQIFNIVEEVRQSSEIPLVLMGYINPVMNYGISRFCQRAAEAGVDGLIIPDVTLEESELIAGEAERSEERRVGKECRAGWGREQWKKTEGKQEHRGR